MDVLQRLQQGAVGTEGNIIDYSYWDTATIATAVQSYTLFQRAEGAAGVNENETNMKVASQLSTGERLSVGALKVFYWSALGTLTDAQLLALYTFFMNSTIDITILSQDYGRWTLAELLGIPVMAWSEPVATNSTAVLSQAKHHGIYPLNMPIILPAQNTFKVTLNAWVAVPAALNGDKLKFSFAGVLERATA